MEWFYDKRQKHFDQLKVCFKNRPVFVMAYCGNGCIIDKYKLPDEDHSFTGKTHVLIEYFQTNDDVKFHYV